MRKATWCLIGVAAALLRCSTPPPAQPLPRPASPQNTEDLSTLLIPVHASLDSVVPLIEAQVPRTFEKTDSYEVDPSGRYAAKYRVIRDPIALRMHGSGLHLSATIHYAIEGCTRTRNPIGGSYYIGPCISCGFGEAMREAQIELQSRLEWTPNWALRSRTTAKPVEFTNRCKVTFAHIDITDWKLAPIVNAQLRDALDSLDRNTPRLAAIRPQAEQLWRSLQTPNEIAPNTWLVIEPLDVALAPIRGDGALISSTLALHARTRIVLGARPPNGNVPLPPLGTAAGASPGVRVAFTLHVPYEEASRILSRELAGHVYALDGGATLRVDSIRVTPAASPGRLSIEVGIDYRGGGVKRYAGAVFLEGTPHFDATSHVLTATDVDYSLDPHRHNPLTRAANRLAHDTIRTALRKNAAWPLAELVNSTRDEITRGLGRPLAAGIALRGRIDAIEPLDVAPAPDAIVIRAVATGSVEVELKGR